MLLVGALSTIVTYQQTHFGWIKLSSGHLSGPVALYRGALDIGNAERYRRFFTWRVE